MDIMSRRLVGDAVLATSGARTIRWMSALIVSLVFCSTVDAGYGYFQVTSSAYTYCHPSLCANPIGSASNPVLDDGKTVVWLRTLGGILQLQIAGFSSDPGAGYLHYLQIDGCSGDGGSTHYYDVATPINYTFGGGTATWYLNDPYSPPDCMSWGTQQVTIY